MLVTGVVLIMLSKGLRRRKKRAFRITAGLLAGSIILHILKGLDLEEAFVAAIMLAALLFYQREFRAKGDPRTRWRALGIGLALLTSSIALGLVFIAIRHNALTRPFAVTTAFTHVIEGLVGVHGPLNFTNTTRGHRTNTIISDVLLALGALTVLTTGYLILRPAEPVARLNPDDETRIRGLLDKHGHRDSLGYFALRRDKSVIWSPTGKACVSYRVVSGVMLASGDPIGDPEAWPGAISAFLTEAAAHAWVPAVIGCSEPAGTAWSRAGLKALEIGDEAIVTVADFSLQGRAMRNVRQAVNRVERAGYTTSTRRTQDIPAQEITELATQIGAWRGSETERGFSMALGRFADPTDPNCVAVMAFQNGALRAFLHFVPWGTDGLSLDLMRRDRTADNGLNELLITEAVKAAPGLGVTRLSLNFAVFRSAFERGERLGAGPVIRSWRAFLMFASRWFQLESLYRFNLKFLPTWEPRYVCYPTARDLPRVAFAGLEAEAFLIWPRLPWSRTDSSVEPDGLPVRSGASTIVGDVPQSTTPLPDESP